MSTTIGRSNLFCSSIILILLYASLLPGRSCVNSSDILNCFSERFSSITTWNVSIREQDKFDKFIENITLITDEDTNRCIQVFLTGKFYKLDVIKLTRLNVGAGGGLIVIGVASLRVKINGVTSVSDPEELRSIVKPISNVSLVVLDGLTFIGSPVPIIFEQVGTVIVHNCDFM